MKKRMQRFFALLLALLCVAAALPAQAQQELQMVTASFHSMVSKTALTWDYPYSDALFDQPATTYQHTLAQSSIGLAVSSFRNSGDDLAAKDANVRAYLTQAGFSDLSSEQYDIEPSHDTIATMIGQKTLTAAGEPVTLLAVGISGAGYKNEWTSNFSIGTADLHEGFSEAAQTVLGRVKDYIASRGITGRVKVWMSGYSRAAAVSNLTGYLLLEDGVLPDEDLYVYTFATPNDTRIPDARACPSIFNIVGSFDPVPSVPFEEWGYGRFGTTLHLPAQETTPDYAARKAAVQPVYEQLTGLDYWNNPDANWAIQKICQMMDDMAVNPTDYTDLFQNLFIRAWTASGLLGRIQALIGGTQQNSGLQEKLSSESYDARFMFGVMLYDFLLQKTGQIADCWAAPVSLVVNLAHEHCPDVYVAWMFSQDDPEKLFVTQTDYRRVFYDHAMTCTVAFADGTDGAGLFSTAIGDETMLVLPAGQACTMTFGTTKATTQPYIMVAESRCASLAERTLCFMSLEETQAEAGETWVLTLPADIGAAAADTTLSTPRGLETPTLDTNDLIQYLGHEGSFQMALLNINFSGDTAKDFLLTAAITLLALLLVAVLLLVSLIFWLVHRHNKRKRKNLPEAQVPPCANETDVV